MVRLGASGGNDVVSILRPEATNECEIRKGISAKASLTSGVCNLVISGTNNFS